MALSRDRPARRRLALLSAAAFAALVVGVLAGAGAGPDPTGPGSRASPQGGSPQAGDPAAAERLSLRQRVGQLVVLSFAGSRLPRYVRDILREGRAAGVILFAHNIDSPAQLRALTAHVQHAARGGAIVATDQEGGMVRTVPFAAPRDGQPAQTSTALGAEEARAAALDLHRYGVNVNLAPVADVASVPGSVMHARAYPGGPRDVASLVAAAVRAYGGEGLGAAVKHFPGLGAATSNTDDSPVTIAHSAAAIRQGELAPFRAAITAGAPLIMASHALYPALDPARIASQSPAVLGRLLRGELRFRGAVITDSLEASAVLARSSVEVAAERSVRAGADLVLLTGPGSYPRVYRHLLALARRSPAFARRVDEAAARVLALKRALHLAIPSAP